MSFFWNLPNLTFPTSPVPVDEGTRDLYGYDIYFHGDLLVTAGGDYARVGGKDNLRAAIYRRLITRPGEFRFRPDYGVGVQTFVKKTMSQANLDALRQRIVDQLSQDRRIDSVEATMEPVSINGKTALKIYVQIKAGGETRKFEPFTFAEDA